MCFGRRFVDWKMGILSGIVMLSIVGCSHTQSSDEALNKALGEAGMSKDAVVPLEGKVTIDNQPPQLAQGQRLLVMLNDPKKPDQSSLEKRYVETNGLGEFAFESYKKGDGVKPGKYVVTFAILQRGGKKGMHGPDQLKNLYNDPEKNEKITQFVIDHQAPGKTDYAFNLDLAGKEANTTPGSHALTTLQDPQVGRH